MGIDLSQFHQTFLEESFEGLDQMESCLLDLEKGDSDDETINTIFRAAHSIKGGSGTFGFDDIAGFTHVLETLLDQMRAGERAVTPEAVALLLQSVDCVRDMLTAAQDGGEPDRAHIDSVRGALEAMLEQDSDQDAQAAPAGEAVQDAAGTSGWRIVFRPHRHILKTGNDPLRLLRELGTLGDIEVCCDRGDLPALVDMDAEECYLAWEIELQGQVEKSAITEVFEWVEDDCDLVIEPLRAQERQETAGTDGDDGKQADIQAGQEPATTGQKSQARAARKGADSGSIRVGIDKIDMLINMVGELVITQSMLGQLGEDFDMSKIDRLRDGLSELERHTRELQESVMRIRMLPISFAFNRFPRLVHDLSVKLGKKIDLKMSGENTELDKTVMEKITDPLVHLVRNSLDHGIEPPEQRLAAGKPETGTVHLNAYHKGGNIIIEISDDGAGLNKRKILDKAIANGIVAEDEQLTDDQIHNLIFEPGFSTADEVSDVSGRGVGMDVVRKNIKALGGSIDIWSEEGKGSTISIRLPLTLAIMDGQLVRVGEQTYIIPLVSIVESLQASNEMINAIAGKAEVYKLRDEYIRIVRLYEAFNLVPDSTDIAGGLLVVVEGDGQRVGLFVDDLLGQQQIVIKSLETNYKRVDGISGATILGDGTVALILDVPGLIALAGKGGDRITLPRAV